MEPLHDGIRVRFEFDRPGDPVWITDPKTKKRVNVGPPKKNITPLIDGGLQLCAKR
jgi:hypothetical protein